MAAEIKTQKTTQSPQKFIAGITDAEKRKDAKALFSLMKKASGEKAAMWGESIVGFGSYHYKGRSGREGDWPLTGFSPRKQNMTIYIMPGFKEYSALLKKLGPHKTSVSCLYIKRLSDIDEPTLALIVKKSVAKMKQLYKK